MKMSLKADTALLPAVGKPRKTPVLGAGVSFY